MAKFDFKYKVRMQFEPGVYVQYHPGVSEVPDKYAGHPYLAMVATPVVETPAAPAEPPAEPAPVAAPKGKS